MNKDALTLEEYQAFMARQQAATAPESHSNDELKPCPFCGQQHKVERGQELHWGMGWFIDCHGRTIMQAFNEADRAKMIEHWNTRPIEDELHTERDEARTLANRASRALARITEYIGTTFDPINPEAVGERAMAEITKLRTEVARLTEQQIAIDALLYKHMIWVDSNDTVKRVEFALALLDEYANKLANIRLGLLKPQNA